jgi:hypothetical protein
VTLSNPPLENRAWHEAPDEAWAVFAEVVFTAAVDRKEAETA